jgi:hypothetical protein
VTDLSNIDELTRWLDALPRQARITIGAWAALRVLPMIGAGPPGAGKLSVDPDEISAGQPDDDENGERFESGARSYEQVHRGDLRRVVAKEISRPSPRREAACLIMYFATLD